MDIKTEAITKFEAIGDYIRRFGFDASQSPDFCVYRYSDVTAFSNFNIRGFRNNFFEISLDLSDGCQYFVDNFKCLSGKNKISVISPSRLQSIVTSDVPSGQISGYSLFF